MDLFLGIVAVLLLLTAFGMLVKGSYTSSYDDKKHGLRGWSLIPLGVGIILLGVSTMYVVNAGEAAVYKTFGAVSDSVRTNPGIGFKAPWTNVVMFDIRNQTINLEGDGTGEDVQGEQVISVTDDNATVWYDVTIRYSLDPNSLAQLARQYPDQNSFVVRAVLPGVGSVTKDAPTTFPAASVRQSRADLSAKITTDLEARLGSVGVIVEQVDPKGITLDPGVQQNYDLVQSAYASAEAAKANLQTALAEAEITKTEAQAQSDADQIIRCGATSTTVEETINGEVVESVKVIPVPTDQCQNRLNEQVLTSKYIDALKIMAQDGNLIVVPEGFNGILNMPTTSTTTATN